MIRSIPTPRPLARSVAVLAVAAILLATPVRAEERKTLDIYFIDTEGGAATLIVTPAGETVLADAGNPGERDAGRIARVAKDVAKVAAIDHLIVTHWHLDHEGGVPPLAQLVPIKNFYHNGIPEPLSKDIRPGDVEAYRKVAQGRDRTLKPGDEVTLKAPPGGTPVQVKVLAAGALVLGEKPGSPQTRACDQGHEAKPDDPSDNARSVAFRLTLGKFDFFDGGDLTWNVEHKLVCPENIPGPADVFQVNHHGLDVSNNPALVRALAPRVAVVNNGARKGGEPGTMRTLKAASGIEAIFQVHRNVRTGAEGNTAPELIANDEEACKGEFVKIAVEPDGSAYTVEVPSRGTRRRFESR